jgi:hypothetical protein
MPVRCAPGRFDPCYAVSAFNCAEVPVPTLDTGAQTERRGDAAPVRDLLGGKATPAHFV